MGIRTRRSNPGSSRPGGRVARLCSALWLPLLLVILAVVHAPLVDESSLGIYLLLLTVTATGVIDLVRSVRRDRRPPGSEGG